MRRIRKEKLTALFINALPVILFFISSFFLLYLLFGLHYVVAVPPMAAFFNAERRKSSTSYSILIFHETLLLILASLGSLNVWIVTILNILVPFVLVFTQSSQFNPKGYYTYMLLFVYMSFVPPRNQNEFIFMLLSLWLLTAYMAAILFFIRKYAKGRKTEKISVQELLSELSELTKLMIDPRNSKELKVRFWTLTYRISGNRKSFSALSSEDTQIENIMSTLLQRFSYMISGEDWQNELDAMHIAELRKLSDFLHETSKSIGTAWQSERIDHAQYLLDTMRLPEGHIRIFIRSILHMVDYMLNVMEESHDSGRKRINWKNIGHEIAIRFTNESFEMRFALRLAIVMALSGIANYLIPMTHSYWIPLNAFLLLQPSSEDSSYHMRTNPLGTFIGCLIEYLIYPFLPGVGGEITFSLVMISLMYCSIPGTWYHPAFHTCYTLTLALMTLGETTAISLRLLYLAIAFLIVFIVNRFFFPIRQSSQFRYSIKALFRLHNSYWNIIRRGLISETDLSVSTDILTDFHMYYEDAATYIRKHPDDESYKELENALIILWHMFAELEQIHYLVRIKSIQSNETEQIIHLITAIQKDFYPIIRQEDFPALYKEIKLQYNDIALVIRDYLRNAEKLLDYKAYIPFI